MARLSSVFFNKMFLVYNSNATSQDIVSLADRFVKTNSSSFPLIDKALYANEALKIIIGWIHDAYGGWLYDDNNNTDFPEATTALTTSQVDYSLPSDSTKVQGISVKTGGSSGSWYPLQPITLEQIQDMGISESQFFSVSGQPRYYRLLAKSFKIYPASNYTLAAGIKLYESREASLFVTTDTTKTPGFDAQYHEGVSIYMALMYAKINLKADRINSLQNDWLLFEQRLKKDYSQRFAEMFPPRITVRDYTRENQ